MTNDQLNRLVQTRTERIEEMLTAKAEEYARGDRLSNFKEAAVQLHCTPEKALLSFVTKHWIALGYFVEDLENGKVQTEERWYEKIGDIINYMILLEALAVERKGTEV
jgi:hypothetical protein